MKKILSGILIASVLLTISCVKKNTPDTILDEMTDSTAVSKYAGMFSNGPYGSVSGTAGIFSTVSGFELKLMDFRSSNGPDLRVYLSQEMQQGAIRYMKLTDRWILPNTGML
jgi:amino acid permease